MILKKPYKFLIKHFKLVHLIMNFLMIYLFYKYCGIISFYSELANSYTGRLSTDPSKLINIFMYLIILIIVILSILLIYLLKSKRKNIKLYIGTLIIYIFVFIFLSYSKTIMGDLEIKIVDLKVLHNVKDILYLGAFLQISQIIFFTIRGLGIDLKKFDFKKDLEEFEITDEDNEEFELNVNIDTNKIISNINKHKRYFGYFYKENKNLFFLAASILIVILCFFIYMNLGVYNKTYKQGDYFTTNDFSMAITNSYITDYDYKNKLISSNKSFVILEVTIRSKYSRKVLNSARPELIIGYDKYYYNNDYSNYFVDIGNSYSNEEINTDFSKYLLIYPIDKKDAKKKIKFRYVDSTDVTSTRAKTINVNLLIRNLDEIKETKNYNLGEKIDLNGSILGNSSFVINSYDLQKNYVLNYNFCFDTNKCFNSIEYVKPSIVNNYDKVLLKLNAELNISNELYKNKSFVDFVKLYGNFKYKIDNVEKDDKTILKSVDPIRVKDKNVYYLELISEALNSNELSLVLKVRDYVYIYKIRS